MPYFKWRGVNLSGIIVRGRLFASTVDQLDEQLLKRNIALLESHPAMSLRWRVFTRVTIADKSAFFNQLQVLVTAGVLLPEALVLVARQTNHRILEEIVHLIATHVQEGGSFSAIAATYSVLFDPLTVQLLSVGELSGCMGSSLQAIVDYLQVRQQFNAQLRAALFVPSITFGFFLLVTVLIFLFIIPHFAHMFLSFGQQLPPLTVAMMKISDFFISWAFVGMLVSIIALLAGFLLWIKTETGRRLGERLLMATPYVGKVVMLRTFGYFFESVAFLLEGGVSLVPALMVVQKTIPYDIFFDKMAQVIDQVKNGDSLAQALLQWDEQYMPYDIVAMIHLGHEVGALEKMLTSVATEYHNKVKRKLFFVTTIIQPLLIIMLGLLILLLIIAVYTPLLTMSYSF